MSSENEVPDESSGALGVFVGLGLTAALGYGLYRTAKALFGSSGAQTSESTDRYNSELQESIRQNRELKATLASQANEIAMAAKAHELELAQARGQDVCLGCQQIEPDRCSSGHCLTCSGECPDCHVCGSCSGCGSSECNTCYDPGDD